MNQKSKYTVIFDECSTFVFLCEHKSNGGRHYTLFETVSSLVNYCNENDIDARIPNWV